MWGWLGTDTLSNMPDWGMYGIGVAVPVVVVVVPATVVSVATPAVVAGGGAACAGSIASQLGRGPDIIPNKLRELYQVAQGLQEWLLNNPGAKPELWRIRFDYLQEVLKKIRDFRY
jgi:hypothetical protein